MKRTWKQSFVIMAVVAAITFTVGCDRANHGDTRSETLAVPVAVTAVVRREFQDEIRAVGTLKAQETALVTPRVPGSVEAVLVDIGDQVQQGQVVARLDPTTFKLAFKRATAALEGAEAAVARAKALFERAEKDYRRASELLAERVIPQSRFDAVEAGYKSARQALSAAKAQYNRAKAALATARKNSQDTSICSPITGIVVQRNVEVGQSVAPGPPIMRIVDQSFLKVDTDLPESDFRRVSLGTLALINVDALPRRDLEGQVVVVNPMVNPQTRTFRLRIMVPNPTGELVPGMFAKIRLPLGKRKSLAVPRHAIHRLPGSGTWYAFVVKGDKAIRRTVRLGMPGDAFAEVIEGLTEGEKVVTKGAGRLRSRTKVVVQEEIEP